MATNLARKFLKLFGDSGTTSNFAKFGSQAAGSPVKTKDITTIQALTAWLNGIQDALNPSNKAPFLEDFNSLFYVMAYQLCYILQKGMSEWDSSTTYFTGDLVRGLGGTAAVFGSLTDNNTGNALPAIGAANGNWITIYPPNFADLLGSIGLTQIPDGLITTAKIASLSTAQLTGLILNAQINSLGIDKLTGGPLPTSLGGVGFATKIFTATPYTGTGVNRGVAHGLQNPPEFVIILRLDNANQSPEIWGLPFTAGLSREMSGPINTSGILSADSVNVNLGISGAVNALGINYQMMAWRSQ